MNGHTPGAQEGAQSRTVYELHLPEPGVTRRAGAVEFARERLDGGVAGSEPCAAPPRTRA